MIRPDQRFFIIDYETTGIDTEKDDPIEVGIIVTDSQFNLIETYESLIKCDLAGRDLEWLHAFKVHGITPDVLASRGILACDAGRSIHSLAQKHTTSRKPILLSDNIQFEWAFTKKLLAGLEWPFHYCGWDSSLFLELAGVGDPKPAHRALADAGLLHAAILKSIGGLKS